MHTEPKIESTFFVAFEVPGISKSKDPQPGLARSYLTPFRGTSPIVEGQGSGRFRLTFNQCLIFFGRQRMRLRGERIQQLLGFVPLHQVATR